MKSQAIATHSAYVLPMTLGLLFTCSPFAAETVTRDDGTTCTVIKARQHRGRRHVVIGHGRRRQRNVIDDGWVGRPPPCIRATVRPRVQARQTRRSSRPLASRGRDGSAVKRRSDATGKVPFVESPGTEDWR